MLGPMLVAPFRAHHRDPLGITRHDFFEVSGNNSLVTIPVVLSLFTLSTPEGFLATFAVVFGLALPGTIMQAMGTASCPRTSSGIPMCYISLGMSLVIIALFILNERAHGAAARAAE